MPKKKGIQYVVKTWTSDIRGAGTDANVFIQIIGSDQDTERLKLSNNKDNFEQGRVDEFTLESDDVGLIQKISIGHDGSNPISGWHLTKVFIKRRPKAGTKKPAHLIDPTSKKSKKAVYDGKETDDYWFFVNRWFDMSADDGAIERELIPTEENDNYLGDSDSRTDAERTSLNQSETSNNKTSLQRSNNKADPFYVASVYDKEPKDELENINQHNQYNETKSDSVVEQLSQKSQSQTGTSMVNRRPCDYSPLQEENTQPMLTIHTEDQEYYTNDFQETCTPRVSINKHGTTALV